MKTKLLLILSFLLLLVDFVLGQDYLLLENTSVTLTTGAISLGHKYLYGKLIFSAFSHNWAAKDSAEETRTSIGFCDTLISQQYVFYHGIVIRNGYLYIFKDCPDTLQASNNKSLKLAITNWETIKSDTNDFVLDWSEDNISLTINDNVVLFDQIIPKDNIPTKPLYVSLIAYPTDKLTVTRLICDNLNTDVKEKSEQIVTTSDNFMLAQNYPNPFNNETIIHYQVPFNSNVVINIYNILGQNIRTLLNNKLNSGRHQVKWDGKDNLGRILPGGIYYLTLQSSNVLLKQKMLFIQ